MADSVEQIVRDMLARADAGFSEGDHPRGPDGKFGGGGGAGPSKKKTSTTEQEVSKAKEAASSMTAEQRKEKADLHTRTAKYELEQAEKAARSNDFKEAKIGRQYAALHKKLAKAYA